MTRQWLVEPREMCKQHLLGEHLEAHIFLSKMQKGYKLDGFRKGSMFFGASYVQYRHDLIAEVLNQPHKTPLLLQDLKVEKYPYIAPTSKDFEKSSNDLYGRCERCRNSGELRFWK